MGKTVPLSLTYLKVQSMMKALLLMTIFCTFQIISQACINNGVTPLNPCAGTTPATCTPPCFNCGACNTRCCQYNIFGRKSVQNFKNRGRGHGNGFGGGFGNGFGNGNIIPCFFGGRSENTSEADIDPAIDTIEKEAFKLCDSNEDTGLTWEEVTSCVEIYGSLLEPELLPTEEEFEMYDVDKDGILFYDEWLFSYETD